METINNVAQAAAKAVWGTPDSKEEPVSGKTGNTSNGEPYDAGNIEPRTTSGITGSDAVKPTNFTSTGNSTTGGDSYKTSSEKFTNTTKLAPLEDNYDPAGGVNTSGTEYKPASTSDTNFSSNSTGNTDFKSSRYTETTDSTNIPPLEDNYNPAGGVNKSGTTDTTAEDRDSSTSGQDTASSAPHKQFGSSVQPNKDLSKAQQDVRDPSEPQTDPKEAEIKSNVDDTGDGLDKGDNPDKVDGPGPRPIAEVAKEYGGDAGNAKPQGSEKREGAQDDEEGDGPQKTSQGEGTGEKYVKSSGLKADGGDFDATQPGAGREADRLLETKGVHHGADKPSATDNDAATDVAGGHEKKSLGEKIKEKIHKPHFKH